MEEKKVQSMIKRYQEATEVNSHYMLFEDDGKDIPCNIRYCEEVKRLTGKKLPCRNIKKYYAEQAARLGESFVYYCPIGFCHWIAPIIEKNKLRGAVYGGPVLITDKQEYLFEELVNKHSIPLEKAYDLYIYLEELQQIQPERVTALSEILFLIAKSLSDSSHFQSINNRGFIENQQQELYESISRIKENLSISDMNYSIQKEKQLLKAIQELDSEKTKQLLNEVLVELFASGGEDTDILITRILELVVILSKGALSGGADYMEVFWLNGICMKEVFEINDMEELCVWLTELLDKFTNLIFKNQEIKYADIIHKACLYIKENYMNKITLEDVAEVSKVTPNYLSKIFKESMGRTFSTYLNQVRIEHSKKLLEIEDMPLEEVAVKSGFADQSYFTKVFKKLMGTSPKKYKQAHIRHSSEEIKYSFEIKQKGCMQWS